MNDAQRELISAHFDGELDEKHRAEAERLLADDPTCRRWWDELAGMRETLRGLPAMSAGDDLADRVLRSAERAMFTDADQSAPVQGDSVQGDTETTDDAVPRRLAATRGDIAAETPQRSGWLARRRPLAWSAAVVTAVAASLVVFVSINRDSDETVAMVPGSDFRFEEIAPARQSEPTDRSDVAQTMPAIDELESFGFESGRTLGKASPTSGDRLSRESSLRDSPAAAPTMKRAGEAGISGSAQPDDERNVPRRYAKDSSGPSDAESETAGRGYGYGGGGYGGAGDYYFLAADERELKEQFAVAAANRFVYVVHVDVPVDAEGGEQLNVLLAKQQIMTAPAGKQSNTEIKPDVLELGVNDAATEESSAFDVVTDGITTEGIDGESAAAAEPQYLYVEMTRSRLQATVVEMRAQQEVFGNVALSDTASNPIEVESLADVGATEEMLDELAETNARNGNEPLSKSRSDRRDDVADVVAAQKSQSSVQSLALDELSALGKRNDPTSEVVPPDQGAVVDLGQRASSRGNVAQSRRRLLNQALKETDSDDGDVDMPIVDPVVQQVISEGQQALSEWRFQNVLVGQQAPPADSAPAADASAVSGVAPNTPTGDVPADRVPADRVPADSVPARIVPAPDAAAAGIDRDEDNTDTDSPASRLPAQAFGAVRQRRSGQAAGAPMFSQSQRTAGTTFGRGTSPQDAGLVGTLFILRFTDSPSSDLGSTDERSTEGEAKESTSDRQPENDEDDDAETTGESDNSAQSDDAETTGVDDGSSDSSG